MENFVRCAPNASVEEVARLMRRKRAGTAVIVDDDGTPQGVLTDRDIVTRSLAAGYDLVRVAAGDVMSQDYRTLSVDYGVTEVLAALRGGFEPGRVVIVDESRRPVGLLQVTDVFALLAQELGALAGEDGTSVTLVDQAA